MRIHNYIKNSFIDYPGNIACVVFTAGCNWDCWYCLNRAVIEGVDTYVSESEVLEFLEKRKGMLDGVVMCGGEPTLQPDLKDFIKKVKGMGYKVKLDTNGVNPEILKNLAEGGYVDYVAMDIKAPFDKYKTIVRTDPKLERVKQSIEYLMGGKIDYEFRTTVCPDLSKEDVVEIAKNIAGAKLYCLQQYKVPKGLTGEERMPYTEDELKEMGKECNMYVTTIVR